MSISSWPLSRWAVVVSALAAALCFPIFTGLAFLAFGPVPYIVGVIFLLGVASIFVANRWLHFATGLVLLLFFLMNAPFLGAEVVRPDHFPEYPVATILLIAAIVGIAGGIGALVQHRRGATPVRLGSAGAILAILAVGLAVGASAASLEAHQAPVAGTSGVYLTAEDTVRTAAANDQFTSPITVAAGKLVKIEVANDDAGQHNFHVEELGIANDLLAGKTTSIWLKTDKTGTYQLYCSLHSSQNAEGKWEGMVSTLTVA